MSDSKSYQVIYQDCVRKLNNISQTLTEVIKMKGLSIDTFNEAHSLLEKHAEYNNKMSAKWNELSQNQQVNALGDAFNDIERMISELFISTSKIYNDANSQRSNSYNIKSTFEVNTDEFKKALEYHQKQSRYTFWGLLGVVLGGALLLYYWGFERGNIDSISSSNKDLVIKIFLISFYLGGRITFVIVFIWLIQFLGKLHSKHSEQSIIYQDRLAGLGTAELIITSGVSTTREQILKDMAAVYLSDKENAFRTKEEPKQEIDLKKVANALKPIVDILKQKTEK